MAESGINISGANIKKGIGHVSELTGLQGRWQKIMDAPKVVCDTGHNVGGWKYISKQLNMQQCRKMRIVFGMVDDKDIQTVMSLLPQKAIYYFTHANTKRAIDENKIKEISESLNLEATCYPDVATAYNKALAEADKDDFIFVGGSSYIVADFLNDCL